MKGYYAANEYWEKYRSRMENTAGHAVDELLQSLKRLWNRKLGKKW